MSLFDELQSSDILFIDSTHIVRTGSDVCFELFNILPRLREGVVVHIHDMFWPFEYPRGWVVQDNRSWNEIYAVRAFLIDNPHWEILMFNHYMALVCTDLDQSSFAPFMQSPGGALWLRAGSAQA